MTYHEDDVANENEKPKADFAQEGSVSSTVNEIGVSVAEASDQLEETLQSGLQAMLVRLRLADESSQSNPLLSLFQNHPVLSVGAATLAGAAAGFVIRRFNPLKGRK